VGRLQAVSGEEALALYTRDAAYLSFSEKERGMIKKGLLADFTVLSVNPVECEPEALQTAEILGTAVGGVWVYEK
jgi:predicted amidohydrolase YtcJ